MREVKAVLRRHGLNTVCEEARCPNQGRCFSKSTATFLILGDNCTRSCGFCAVSHDLPDPVDSDEPLRIAEAVRDLGLHYVVVTSVTRDDLPDGGAGQFARAVRCINETIPGVRVEILVPDFRGDRAALSKVIESRPDVFNHNVETVPRLYPTVRPEADYNRSLGVLAAAKEMNPGIPTKSGIMLGLGEEFDEVVAVLGDLRDVGCSLLTIGQYLRPRVTNLPVKEYVNPEMFDQYRMLAIDMGFEKVASGPLVRSSMDAEEMINA